MLNIPSDVSSMYNELAIYTIHTFIVNKQLSDTQEDSQVVFRSLVYKTTKQDQSSRLAIIR